MRSTPGDQHQWTLWQAPQLPLRNHWLAPLCSRTWSYVSSMYEFGGVSSLYFGGHHMLFSTYSMPLQLAYSADSWDGDIVAEDHHCYIKTFFYSIYASAQEETEPGSTNWSPGYQRKLKIRPVLLPVKSTPVISSKSNWQSYVDRWH